MDDYLASGHLPTGSIIVCAQVIHMNQNQNKERGEGNERSLIKKIYIIIQMPKLRQYRNTSNLSSKTVIGQLWHHLVGLKQILEANICVVRFSNKKIVIYDTLGHSMCVSPYQTLANLPMLCTSKIIYKMEYIVPRFTKVNYFIYHFTKCIFSHILIATNSISNTYF